MSSEYGKSTEAWRVFLSKSIQFFSKLTCLVAIALAVNDSLIAIAQQRLPAKVAQALPSAQPVSVEDLQAQVDTLWGASSAEVRSRIAGEDLLIQPEAGCATQGLPTCTTLTQTILRGFQTGQRRYNLNLNFDYDRLTSTSIRTVGFSAASDYTELKRQLDAAYGPGTAKYTAPESPEVTYWEWRLPITTIGLSYLAGLEARTELLYYPTPATSAELP